ncbi:MAG: hypothetical protein RBU23_07690 [Candidatus Auribacterota bacterium]|nr:hypothetical protein [Candidatus Auribacterota bacterium]
MGTPVFIAKILGPCFVVVSLGMLLNRSFFQKVMEDYCKNYALIFFTGMASLAFGLVIVCMHNVWVADWTVLITIFGWSGLIKGIWIVVFPNTICTFMGIYQQNKSLLLVHSALALVLGALLTVGGYFAG